MNQKLLSLTGDVTFFFETDSKFLETNVMKTLLTTQIVFLSKFYIINKEKLQILSSPKKFEEQNLKHFERLRKNQMKDLDDAMFLTQFGDGFFYFYSNNKCYKTDSTFLVLDKQKVDFPFSLNG